MKAKFTIITLICCLFYLPFSANAQGACEFPGQDGDYTYSFSESGGKTYITFKPVVAGMGSNSLTFFYGTSRNAGMPGYQMQPNVAFEITNLPAAGSSIYFAFDYSNSQGPGNKGNYMPESNRFEFVVGSCTSAPTSPPTVSITSPAASDPFTAPASVSITANATATESGATITKVEFYVGGTIKIGEATSAPYTFSWLNVQPGNYSLTAKATDNNNASTTSTAVAITVGGVSTQTWCGSGKGVDPDAYQGKDLFDWKAETIGSNVKVTLHPKNEAVGCNFALLIVTEGGGGGHPMAVEPSGDLTFTYNGATGTNFKFYFVYNIGNNGPQTNNANNQINYAIGANCAAPLPVTLIDFNSKLANNGTVNLTWATSSEQNNSYFLVERSADGKNFTTLQKVVSKDSNSQIRLDYQYNDTKPLAGNNYYRLTQFDSNGDHKIVGQTSQSVSFVAQGITLAPNPLVGSELTINTNDSKATSTKVTISNIQGAVIFNQIVNANNGVLKINLNAKPSAGLYLVKIADSQVQKLIIK